MARSTVDRINLFGKNCGAVARSRCLPGIDCQNTYTVTMNGRYFTSEVFQDFMKANNMKHTFSAPYHPATNGQAERIAQTFKQAMKAAKGDMGAMKLHLEKFLLAYRNATHATTEESPAMLLLGRRLRTRLDAVRSDTRKTVERRQAISAEQKRGKDRSFSVGEKLAVRNYRDDQRWIADIIQEKKGTRAYAVQVVDTVWRRHSDKIRASDMAPAPAPDIDTSEQVVHEPRETVQELNILYICQQHQPHPAQFGFATDRGTDMAIALAHGVSEHFNRRGSPVFTCRLDAQGAFDHIPHSVTFSKLDGVLPDDVWRFLYRWYSSMYVTGRLNGSLGRRLRVERGVRQGSITSPCMFNLVYQELVQRVNEMNCGISIGDKHFNIFCYADDILLASTTITGLQVMIDVCTDYIEAHGLKFNASKTN